MESKAREIKLKQRELNRPKLEPEAGADDDAEPEMDPLAEIADELERILAVERKKITALEPTFNLDL